jgi:HNH endonuclease
VASGSRRSELTFDHVIPRANGGTTSWSNILSCCVPCNKAKRDRPANWSGRKGAGLRPLKAPRQPTTMELLRAGLEFLDPAIREDYGSWLYWSSELQA